MHFPFPLPLATAVEMTIFTAGEMSLPGSIIIVSQSLKINAATQSDKQIVLIRELSGESCAGKCLAVECNFKDQ